MTATELTKKKRKKLRKLINMMNMQNERHFPAVLPFVEAFNVVLNDDELDFLLAMGNKIHTLKDITSIHILPKEKFDTVFDSLRAKGFIKTKYNEKDEEFYVLNAIIVGWIEAQVPYLKGRPEEKEFARKFQNDFLGYVRRLNFFPFRSLMNVILRPTFKTNQSMGINTLPVTFSNKNEIQIDRPLSVKDSEIFPMNSVNDMILEWGKTGKIAQFNCMCRRLTEQIDDPCRLKIPENGGCIGFGEMIRPYVKYGHARPISKEEAIDVIQMTRELGAVHTIYHERDDANLPEMGLCNCCWDCCGFLRGYNMGSAPIKYRCYYQARFTDHSGCTGCGKCSKFCPTNAIKVIGKGKDKKAILNEKKCLGCGQCVYQCPQNVLELVPVERDVFLPILKKSEARITPVTF